MLEQILNKLLKKLDILDCILLKNNCKLKIINLIMPKGKRVFNKLLIKKLNPNHLKLMPQNK